MSPTKNLTDPTYGWVYFEVHFRSSVHFAFLQTFITIENTGSYVHYMK